MFGVQMSKATPSIDQERYVTHVATLGARNLPPGGELTLKVLLEAIDPHAKTIFDLGCNSGWVTGQLAERFPTSRIIGVDLNPKMIESAALRNAHLVVEGRVKFAALDCGNLSTLGEAADAAVCAGSGAFFADPINTYSKIRAAMMPRSTLADAHYLYDRETPDALVLAEVATFGVASRKPSAGYWLDIYARSGWSLRGMRTLPRWALPERAEAEIYRKLLLSLPEYAHAAEEILKARRLTQTLAAYRRPATFILDASSPSPSPRPRVSNISKMLAVQALFNASIERLPIESIESLPPHLFLAYVGEAIPAPGGVGGVQAVIDSLQRYGLAADAKLVDVGCFTGLSTIMLSQRYPSVVGIDLEFNLIRAARDLALQFRSGVRFEIMDGAQTTFADSTLDAYVMFDTLAYAKEPQKIVMEAARVLRHGGILVEILFDVRTELSAIEAELRITIGPDIRVASLSSQIESIEYEGFELIELARIVDGTAVAHRTDEEIAAMAALEIGRNPALRECRDRLLALLHRYLGHSNRSTVIPGYVSVFRRRAKSSRNNE